MSIRGSAVMVALAFGLVSCGGTEAKTTTVVQTVTQPVAAAPSTAEGVPTTTEPSTPEPAAPAAGPVANLRDGAVAIQGRYRMRIVRANDNGYISGDEDESDVGAERLWVAETVCQDVCSVQLRRELKNGSYERTTLEQGVDERSFGETNKVNAKICGDPKFSRGPVTKKLSLRATAVEQRNGQPTAKRLDGHVSLRQTCETTIRLQGRANVLLRGRLEG